MELAIVGLNGVKHVVELGEVDTFVVMRRKVAAVVGLPEEGFDMSLGGEVMDAGYNVTQLSAGDVVVVTETVTKFKAIAELRALGETATAERLERVRDPAVACLLLQAEVATAIPKRFLCALELTQLDLSTVSKVTEIGPSFLDGCTSLTSINLSGLVCVTKLGYRFLGGCSALCALDCSPLRSVTHIEGGFLYGCTSLTRLDLSGFTEVTTIGMFFLTGCTALRTLDLSPLRSVTLMDDFMGGCAFDAPSGISPLFLCVNLSGCSDVVSSTVKQARPSASGTVFWGP